MNNREVKTIKIILRTRSKYEEMKSAKGANSEFIIIRTKFSSVRHNYDYRVCYYCMIGWVIINMNYSFISESYHNYPLRTLS